MRYSFLSLAGVLAVAGLAGTPSRAAAQDPSHDRFHDQLDHNRFHRQLDHREAHQYPMTWGQHGQLHDQLQHDRFHDKLDHRQFHRDSYGQPYQGYSGYSGSYYQPSPFQGYSVPAFGNQGYSGYGGASPYQGYGVPAYGYQGYSGYGVQGRPSFYYGR